MIFLPWDRFTPRIPGVRRPDAGFGARAAGIPNAKPESGPGACMNGSQPATDLTTVLAGDHRELDRLCTELELGQGSPENRKDLSDHLTAELVRHAVAEEPYLAGDGDLAEADSLMRQLEGVGPQETRFERLLGGLIRAVRRHVREEGPAAVRQARLSCSPERLAEL